MIEEKVKRSEFRTFIDVDPGYEDWALLGEGAVNGEVAYNPEISEEVYIHEDSANSEVERYNPSMAIEATAIAGNDVFDFIDGLRQSRATLDDAHTQIVNVFMYDGTSGAYEAELQDVAISIESFGGEGGTSAKINYTIHYRGDPTHGTFDTDELTFTPDA
jgi:hypothetical protein